MSVDEFSFFIIFLVVELLQLTEVDVAEAVGISFSTVEETGFPFPLPLTELNSAVVRSICRGSGGDGRPSIVKLEEKGGLLFQLITFKF